MNKGVAAITAVLLALIAAIISPPPSFAQRSCTPIKFPTGKDTAVLSGLAPADDVICYSLDADIGQKFALKVLRGDNTFFSVVDLPDAENDFTFTAQRTMYEIDIGQLSRARRQEKFRISVERSGSGETAAEEPWTVRIALSLQRLMTDQVSEDGSARLQLSCAKASDAGFGVSLHNYAGDALGRQGDAVYLVKMVVADSRAGNQSFDFRMRYSGQEQAWTSETSAPRGFIRSFEAGSGLTLVNGSGMPVAAFDLHGSSKYAKAALVYCGGDNTPVAVADTATSKGGNKVVSAENVSAPHASSDTGAGTSFRDCEHCPEMVPLPPGTFMMGARQEEMTQLKYVQWATPQHQVAIGYPFAIGRFEITVDEVDAYVKETGAQVGGTCGIRTLESGPNKFKYTGTLVPGGDKTQSAPYVIYIGDGSYAQPGLAVTARQPAVCISRNEMKDYLDWLSIKTGKHYRLPTEAEWEYAYRAGTDSFSYWGNDFKQTCDYANFADRKSGFQGGMAASCSEKIHPDWTAEVGSYKPNPWGLYDMGGNAQEAVEDCFHNSYQGAPTDGSPWTEPDCVLFAARSGDYELTQFSMRASERLLFGYTDDADDGMWTRDEGSDERFNVMGFRVAVSLDDTGWDKAARAAKSENQAKAKEADVAQPTATNSVQQYNDLPRAVKTYVEDIRNSCKEFDLNGIPANKLSGIRPISLADGTPALLIENETLCSDHYSGANCSNRGCDVMVMAKADGGWKEIFHEHLYDDTFDISDDKLNSISASIYAGDPHCGPAPSAEFLSSDSCDVTIRYENKGWVWQKGRPEATAQVIGDQVGTDTAPTLNDRCGGSYIFVQLGTYLYDPLLGPKVDRQVLEAKGDAASWYDVECDAARRPSLFTHYEFSKKTGLTVLEYDGQSNHVARQVAKSPEGNVLETSVIARDAKMRPARIEVLGPNGEAEKIGLFSYQDDYVDLNISEAKSGMSLWHAREWFDGSGALERAHWHYPRFWYDYHYDPKTGLYPSHEKYDGDLKFEITNYEYDEFGNTLSRRSTCIVDTCDTVTNFGKYDHGHLAHEESQLKTSDQLVWENEYDAEGRLAVSHLNANGRFAIKFIVERDGPLVKRTVAYSPKGKKLFVYDRAETVYIARDGSPVNGGKYKRFTKHNVW